MSFKTSRNDRRGVGNRDADEEDSDLPDFSPIGSRDGRLGVGRDILRCKKDRTPPRHLLKPCSGEMKQVFAGAALEAVLATARRPPSNEDSRTDRAASSS